ncbi:uncharacterized protein [Parasteatoda tepidariorum]|uniref:uncharacterized protein n=1 Tax=Parasteatoda tepidariorum TaxID=114398 RepID=UPI00077FE362|nr:uncharacterized protein LOC107450890 [Parasteatoda tepidariorum]XP_015922306.1 uncharacterized protein LOC107450890 [Parasteatoda tepidariorum]XP_015922307.1 uncharacterized protein LOC107450890 [Parasteatoda tepidariorum]XP_042894993.1 uncharacterized protein LOC107450890 [Parasteatoda tepidariorum]XP_042894999.1 uncharacterized protein LOC107450890 [Parasteatoda tepidariorum]
MSLFEYVSGRYCDANFDIYSIPPRTPHEMIVTMKEFKLSDLQECIILNICGQGEHLRKDTINNVIDFLKSDFSDITKRTYLQVLVHFSKMDLTVLYTRYEAFVSVNEVPNHRKKTIAQYYDFLMSSFILKSSQLYDAEESVTPISQEYDDIIRAFLLRPSVLSVLSMALKHLLGPSHPNDKDLENELSKMNIYSIKRFAPMDNLRGCCLLDGILVCTTKLAGPKGTANNIADLLTLALHESYHYLARVKTNDLNMSSTHSFKSPNETVRLDPQSTRLPLEMGRYVEELFFDGVQPHWSISKLNAAEAFLHRVQTRSSFPIIPKTDHKMLGLEGRLYPSPPFGIDIEDEDVFF